MRFDVNSDGLPLKKSLGLGGTNQESMSGHISVRRLLKVAITDDMIFTLNEFIHLKKCFECFRAWREFVETNAALRADPNSNKTKPIRRFI